MTAVTIVTWGIQYTYHSLSLRIHLICIELMKRGDSTGTESIVQILPEHEGDWRSNTPLLPQYDHWVSRSVFLDIFRYNYGLHYQYISSGLRLLDVWALGFCLGWVVRGVEGVYYWRHPLWWNWMTVQNIPMFLPWFHSCGPQWTWGFHASSSI